MRKLPNGMSNYEAIVKDNRIYVDKTMYIEKMEQLSDRTIMFFASKKIRENSIYKYTRILL